MFPLAYSDVCGRMFLDGKMVFSLEWVFVSVGHSRRRDYIGREALHSELDFLLGRKCSDITGPSFAFF